MSDFWLFCSDAVYRRYCGMAVRSKGRCVPRRSFVQISLGFTVAPFSVELRNLPEGSEGATLNSSVNIPIVLEGFEDAASRANHV